MNDGQPCRRCGQPIPTQRRSDAVYCSVECKELSRIRKPYQRIAPRLHKCEECGKQFGGRRGQRFCCRRCGNTALSRARRRRNGAKPMRQERVCDACGKQFVTRIAKQLRCSQACAAFIKNRRRLERQGRKTNAPARVSPEMIARRAMALRPEWAKNPDLS